MDSVWWNLILYQKPTFSQLVSSAKEDDLIPYRFCPHCPDGRGAVAFCLDHIAFMCSKCWQSHSFSCKRPK